MKVNEALGALLLAAGAAVLGGFGFLAYMVGQTWTESTTQSLVTGLVAVCGGGAVVLGLLVALIVGIPMATRYLDGMGRARQSWDPGPSPGPVVEGQWRELPGQLPQHLPGPDAGLPPWGATGGGNFDLLPPPSQDKRFSMDTPKRKERR
jgi:hypothetical protein